MSSEVKQQQMQPQATTASGPQHPARRAPGWRILLLAAAGMAAGYWLGGDWLKTAERRRDPSGLHIPEESLDFGNAWPEEDFFWTLPVTNRSDKPVHVAEFEVGCHCMSVEPKSFILSPGQKQRVRLHVNLSPDSLHLADRPLHFNVTLAARLENAPWYARWQLTGRVHPPVKLSATSLHFDDVAAGYADEPAQVITVQPLHAGVTLRAKSADRQVRARLRRARSPSESLRLEVRPTEHAQPGWHDLRVRLEATVLRDRVPDGLPPRLTLSVPVRLRVLNDVRPVERTVHMGMGRLGETLRRTVTLISRRRAFEVVGLKCSPAGVLDATPQEQENTARLQRAYELRVPIAALGHQQAQLTFAIRQEKAQGLVDEYDVEVPVFFHGATDGISDSEAADED